MSKSFFVKRESPQPSFSWSELDALRREAKDKPSGGVTASEWAERHKIIRSTAASELERFVRQGKMTRVTRGRNVFYVKA